MCDGEHSADRVHPPAWTFSATILLFTVLRLHNTYVNLPPMEDPSSTVDHTPTLEGSGTVGPARSRNAEMSFGAFLGDRGAISESREGGGTLEEDDDEKALAADMGISSLSSLP